MDDVIDNLCSQFTAAKSGEIRHTESIGGPDMLATFLKLTAPCEPSPSTLKFKEIGVREVFKIIGNTDSSFFDDRIALQQTFNHHVENDTVPAYLHNAYHEISSRVSDDGRPSDFGVET